MSGEGDSDGVGDRKRAHEEEEEPTTTTFGNLYADMRRMEEEAQLLLGGSDETKCTYEKGVVPRQMLYSCRTCSKDGQFVGVCVACSQNCHDDHDLVELYTKRRFQCDCGTTRTAGDRCQMRSEENLDAPASTTNSYAVNFDGCYCVCKRPYPDEGDKESDDSMLQCEHCEDWFHTKCISTGGNIFSEDLCSSIIRLTCPQCVTSVPLLSRIYANVATVDNGTMCLSKMPDGNPSVLKLLLWMLEYRHKLCNCDKCKTTYTEAGVDYLLDDEDVLRVEETTGTGEEENVMDELAKNMTPHQIRIVAEGFNMMEEELKQFLDGKPEGYVVTADDIHAFFADLKVKRARRDDEEDKDAPHTA